MTTASALIRGALDKLHIRGAGQSVNGTDAAHCLAALNALADSMRLSPTFAVQALTTIVPLTGQSVLTIGPGQQIDIPRPVRIEMQSFVRVSGQDHRLGILQLGEFNAIALKTSSGGWPAALYYDAGVPTGNLYVFPQGTCELHLVTQGLVAGGNFADLTTEYILPPGYERMFVYSLAEDIAPDFEVQADPAVLAKAASLRRLVKRANLQVPQLSQPLRLTTEAAFLAG